MINVLNNKNLKIMKTFGTRFHGNHAVFAFNCKLDKENKEFMQTSYPELNIFITIPKHGKELVRIEGCVLSKDYHVFKLEMDKAILRSKMNADHAKLDKLENMDRAQTKWELEEANLLEDDDLPF